MFKRSANVFLLFELLLAATAERADQNALADIESDAETLQRKLIAKRSNWQPPQIAQCKDGCSDDILQSLDKVSSEIEDLRAKLGEQCQWPSANCPIGFTFLPAAESCYKILYEKSNWNLAGQKCRNLHRGSDLVAITSEAENTALKTFLSSELSKNPDKNACLAIDQNLAWAGNLLWTSGQRQKDGDCKTPYVWKLLSGEIPFTYTDWNEGEPNCGDNTEFCMHLWANKGYQWNDVPCNLQICTVCEYTPK